jgi:hypothetical protein
MPDSSSHSQLSRRKVLAGIGATGVALTQAASFACAANRLPEDDPVQPEVDVLRCRNVETLRLLTGVSAGAFIETLGFYAPGDGGGALYRVRDADHDTQPNDADVLELKDGLVAVLVENEAVNYRMFGAVGDGQNDDGVQIKQAHHFANQHGLPVVQLSGEFWILRTNDIPITTNVSWGKTVFHIDERYNSKRHPRFVVLNDEPTQTLSLDDETKASLLKQIKPGVQIIPELAAYAGHLITLVDTNDRIGIRSGDRYSKRGWAREELFYVEEEGRIIGDVAWQFSDFTSVTATPCNRNYLVIEGGGFHFSGDTPENSSPGYHQLGISIHRSRTIVREQWMGLEEGRTDTSLQPRSGLYSLHGVFDVTLENIRAMPWEKNRRDPARVVEHGTYGIAGARMLNCTFRNLTAEAGWVAWGVFGTNLNKNFRVENCRLNRIDVHFHCWNLHIRDSEIGFKGITVTGGGDLVIENTTRYGNNFVGFRQDYGAKWDGHIRLSGCKLKPNSNGSVSVLSFQPADFDYQYPIGSARSIQIEDLTIDYAAVPESTAACWLVRIADFSATSDGARLFFPHRVQFRNIAVQGREQGVRLMRVPAPGHYRLDRPGHYDGDRIASNCSLICTDVQLEALRPKGPDDAEQVHLLIGGDGGEYDDETALYPTLYFANCQHLVLRLSGCIASLFCDRCGINLVTAKELRGDLVFRDCHLQPVVQEEPARLFEVASTLGTRFTNCTVHAPLVGGSVKPELVDRFTFWEFNKSVRYHHLHTMLGNDVIRSLQLQGIVLSEQFIAMLSSHHELATQYPSAVTVTPADGTAPSNPQP